jgi:hypothetical protein
MELMLLLLLSVQTGISNHAIGNVNKDQAEIMTTHTLPLLLMIAKVSLMTLSIRTVICTIMEYVPNKLQLLLTSSTMPLQDIEKDHLILSILVLTLPNLKKMLNKFQLVKLLLLQISLIVHKRLL